MIAMHHSIFGRRYGEAVFINAVACTTFNMTMTYAGGSITVDWGDGTSTTNSAFNKTYASPFTGTIKITGDLDKVAAFLSLSNTGIYIDLKEFWKFTILSYLYLSGNCFINNSVTEIPRVTTSLFFSNLPNFTMTGNAIDLPRVTNTLFLQVLPNLTLTGNASDLPLSVDVFISSIGSTSLTYTALTTKPTTKARTRIEISTKFTTTQTDEMLIDYATYSTTWNAPREIRLSSLGRTTASDSAVATLVSRGVTITLV